MAEPRSVFSAALLLFFVMDPFGNVPLFVAVLEPVPAARRRRIMARELVIALGVLLVFLAFGKPLLAALGISEPALRIAGGVVLFLIAIRMVFGRLDELLQGVPDGEPWIVPLAVPAVAGPSAIATVLVLVGQEPERRLAWLVAVLLAWSGASAVLLAAPALGRVLGRKGAHAVGRLMGLLLTTVAVEMLMQGLRLALAGA